MIVVGAALLAGAGYAIFRRPRTAVEPVPQPLDGARELAKTLKREVWIEPFHLRARIPDGWTCTGPNGWTMECGSVGRRVSWSLDLEPSTESIEQLTSERTADTATRTTIAGFDGYYTTWSSRKRPESLYAFVGWAQHPARGRVRLRVDLSGDSNADGLGVAEAVMLTTERAPEGLPAWWPNSDEIDAALGLTRWYAALADDQKSASEWTAALNSLQKSASAVASTSASAVVIAPTLARKPSVTELVQRRVEALSSSGDATKLGSALDLTRALRRWDAAAALPLYATLAERARKGSEAHPNDAHTAAWFGREVSIARDRHELGVKEALPVLAVALRKTDPALIFRDGREALVGLFYVDHPAAHQLLTDWFGRLTPTDENHTRVASMIRHHLENPAVRRHANTMLSATSKYKGDQRICDLYAEAFAQSANVKLKPTDPVPARDKAIAAIRAWVNKP